MRKQEKGGTKQGDHYTLTATYLELFPRENEPNDMLRQVAKLVQAEHLGRERKVSAVGAERKITRPVARRRVFLPLRRAGPKTRGWTSSKPLYFCTECSARPAAAAE